VKAFFRDRAAAAHRVTTFGSTSAPDCIRTRRLPCRPDPDT
jgi:hypothetical protein